MPELPEVEAVCRKLRQDAQGAVITAAHFPRPGITAPQKSAAIARKIAGRAVEAVRRRGKNIFIDLSGGMTLHVHLRMTGDLHTIADRRFRPATTRAWFELDDGRAIIFNDPRSLGRIRLHTASAAEAIDDALGIEPLDPTFSPATLLELARRSRQPAKLFLLDQTRVAGVGNIYAAEALFEARIDPRRPMNGLSRARLNRLHAAIVGTLTRAVQSACTAYMRPGRFVEAESFPLQVYDCEGEPCGRCGRIIRRIGQGGRSTYYCPGCQS